MLRFNSATWSARLQPLAASDLGCFKHAARLVERLGDAGELSRRFISPRRTCADVALRAPRPYTLTARRHRLGNM
jgi:hypothetical protein